MTSQEEKIMNNPPAQDQPVTPQAEEWADRFDERFHHIDINECGYDKNGEPDNLVIIRKNEMKRYGLTDVKGFIRRELKISYDNGVEEGKKLMVEETKNQIVILFEQLCGGWCVEQGEAEKAVDNALSILSPNQEKE